MAERLSFGQPVARGLLAMAAAFTLLGLFFAVVPRAGGLLFGLAAGGAGDDFYMRALGVRNIGLGAHIALLTMYASRRAIFLLLAAATIIPTGDLVLLLIRVGWTFNSLAHVFSFCCFAGMAWWVRGFDAIWTSSTKSR